MKNNFLPFTEVETRVINRARQGRESLAQRYPLTFALAGTFGFVCTLYGFEKLIDKVEFFVEHPWVLLFVGVGTLYLTGLALRKLG